MRIAIVNDTQMAAECLKRVIHLSTEHDIAWIACDGREAVEMCAQDTPDIILMDLIMPVMDGVEATRRIMQNSPCAILVVTSTVSGNTAKVFEAMGAGALDAVNTPVLNPQQEADGDAALLKKIHIIGKLIDPRPQDTPKGKSIAPATKWNTEKGLLAIGASTGGPGALAEILGGLPADFPAAIVIVQHVDRQFVQGFANWLDEQTPLPVRLAIAGDRPETGRVLIANSTQHLHLGRRETLDYTDEPKGYLYQPSVNVFFDSVATHWTGEAIGLLLTGMGRDGATGLLAMHNRGFLTIAQDQASCTVYGMPRAAADLRAAQEILDLTKISPALMRHFARTDRQKRAAHG